MQAVIRAEMAKNFAAFWPHSEAEILYAYIDAVSKQRSFGLHVINAELPVTYASMPHTAASILLQQAVGRLRVCAGGGTCGCACAQRHFLPIPWWVRDYSHVRL